MAGVTAIPADPAQAERRQRGVGGQEMIRNFSDHAANERTFLAWVRTAIAVMAFGFLVEKFDLFLQVAALSLEGRQVSIAGQRFASVVGISLIVMGTGMVAIAGVRFLQIKKRIDQPSQIPGTGSRLDVALAALLVLLGCAMFFYLTHALVAAV
jgi:putative membrane protein